MGSFQWTDEHGRRRRFRKLIASEGSMKEATILIQEIKAIADRMGALPPPWCDEAHADQPTPVPEEPSVHVFENFAEDWFQKYVLVENSENEQTNKRSSLDTHLLPHFRGVDIRKIGAEEIAGFKAVMKQKRKQNQVKKGVVAPLSHKTINYHLGVLRKMLNTAKEWGKIETSVPRIRPLKVVEEDVEWFGVEDRERILETCRAHRPEWFPYFALGFHTGLRPGELASLKWSDVQLAGSSPSIRVRATRRKKPGPNGELDGPTKTNRNRTVPLNSAAVEVLKAHRHLRGEYVFYNSAGRPLDQNGGTKVLHWLCRKAGIRVMNRHSLRHSFASHVVMQTGNLVAVKELLGHSSIATTMKYAHLAPDFNRGAVETIVRGNFVATDENEGRKSESG